MAVRGIGVVLVLLLACVTLFSSCSSITETAVAPELDNEYSQACNAYREFLLGQRNDGNQLELRYVDYNFGASGAEFTLVDINSDGIPELHFRFRSYAIFSYCDGQILEVAHFQQKAELLNNLAVYTDYWDRNPATEATRNYIELGADLKPRFSLYFDRNDATEIYRIAYNGQNPSTDVSKQMFETITTPYVEYCTDPKNYDMISWTNYSEWLEQNIDEYVPESRNVPTP
jgi:hypothetical protein